METRLTFGTIRANCHTILPCILCALLFLVTSCIGYADKDDEPEAEPADPVVIDTTAIKVDSAYQVTAEDLHGEWMAQYTGYDPQQDKTSTIRRLVAFLPDGSYNSHVLGILDITDSTKTFKEFEHEHGTYAFNEKRQMMTYYVDYDSLINFASDQMERHQGKLMGPTEITQYGERITFSLPIYGKRYWIRADGNLMTTDDHDARLYYIMQNQ